MHQRKGRRRSSWPWVPFEEMKRVYRGYERMREFLREWKIIWCEEKKEEEGFCREKEEEL